MVSRIAGAIGAASLLLASGAAAAQAAAPLSLAHTARAGAEVSHSNELRGPVKYIAGAALLALLIWGAIELLDNDDEAFPTSP